jgi:cellobiose phosphorylase
VNEKRDAYRCVHKRGLSELYTEKCGIASTVSIFVPRELACELWSVKVKNLSDKSRELCVLAFCGSDFDAGYARQGYNTEASHFDAERGLLYIEKGANFNGKGVRAHGFMGVCGGPDGFAGAYNAIVGPYGSFAYPDILNKGGCNNEIGCGEKLAYAMEKKITLAPGEEAEVVYIMGIAFSLDEAKAMKDKCANAEFFAFESAAVVEKFASEVEGVSIDTPDEMLNNMFEWLKHQSNLGSRWARVRHNG